jgi:urease accessory protein
LVGFSQGFDMLLHGDTRASVVRQARPLALGVLTVAALASSAQAHAGHGAESLGSGFGHPLTGLDHVLAMIAVGLWAVQQGGRRVWLLPLCFVAVMIGGAALGATGVGLPFAEGGIAMSVLVLGALVAGCVRLPAVAGALLVGAFALFHGHAHGAEMPAGAGAVGYATGFLAATALLHAAGLGLGLALQRGSTAPRLARTLGAATAVAGLLLLVG